MQPAYAANMWNEALNKRLGTEVSLDIVWSLNHLVWWRVSICSQYILEINLDVP